MIVKNISDPISWMISQLISLIVQCWSYLDSIVFANTSMLEFIICLNIIGVVIPLLFARSKTNPKVEKGGRDRVEDSN